MTIRVGTHQRWARLAIALGTLALVTNGGVSAADPAFGDAHAVPGLAALNADGTAIVDALSCSSNGNCAAIGTYLDASRLTQGFVANEVNDVWGPAEEIPGLGALNVGGQVADYLAISCPASGECVAGGNYTDANKFQQGFVVTEHQGVWGFAAPVPRDASLPATLPLFVDDVVCTSVGQCVAGGFYVEGSGTAAQSWVASDSAGTWSPAVEVPGTAALNQGIIGTVQWITCPAAGACAMVGAYTQTSGAVQVYVDSQVAGVWGTAAPVPGLVALNTGNVAASASISCGAVGTCAIGGAYTLVGGRSLPFVADEVGGVWQNAQVLPGSDALNTGGQGLVYTVACPAPGSCEAVGSYTDGSGNLQAMVDSESGGAWGTAVEMPGTAALNLGDAEAFDVSCVSVGDCRAVGYYTDGSNNFQAFLASEAGSTWQPALEAPGSAALNTEGDAQLNVVSCTVDGACATGGQYKDSSGYLQAMILDASTPPPTAPAAPGAHAASHAKGQITVTVVPGSDGGSPITAYQYSINSGPWRHGSSGAVTFKVSHLKPKSKVRVRVRAVNVAGASAPSPSVTVKVR